MKRKVTALLTALLLTLTLCVPTLAWTEYGAIYDETDALGSDELSDLGQYTLPQLTEALHLDLRVDIFTNEDVSEGTTAGDIATYVYKDSGYGWGEEKDGISLTLLLEPLPDGSYTLAETDWCVYAMLSETRGDGQELSGLVYDAVEPYLNNAQSWTGEDMAASAEALCQAVNAMAATAADYLSADFPTEAQQPETVQSGEAPELGSTGMNYVFDLRGMLSDGEREELEDRAEDIALRRSCGIYTLFVENFTAYGYGDDPYTALYQIYHAEGLGVGEDRNGVIIMLSMKERDYAMFVYGEWAEYAFDLLDLILGQPGHGDEVEQHHQQHGHHVVEDQRLFRGMDLIHGSFLLSLGAETDRNSASELVCILWITAILARRGKRVQKTICERKTAGFAFAARLTGSLRLFLNKFRERRSRRRSISAVGRLPDRKQTGRPRLSVGNVTVLM